MARARRQLEAERHRLGMDAMRAADHRRPPMFEGAIADGLRQRFEILQDHVARFAHLEGQRRVDYIRRCQPEMQPAGGRSDFFRHGRRECDDVVLRGLFDRLDPRDVETAALANVTRRLERNDPGSRHGIGGGGLHEQPGFVPALVAPDPPHVGVGVARNHLIEVEPLSRNLQSVHVTQHRSRQ
jgi:hypothetical protein